MVVWKQFVLHLASSNVKCLPVTGENAPYIAKLLIPWLL